jgi:PAS domain S-box-containing protein
MLRPDLPDRSQTVIVTGPDLRITHVAGASFRRRSRGDDGLVGQKISDVVSAEAWRSLAPWYHAAYAGKAHVGEELRFDGQQSYRVEISPCIQQNHVTSVVTVLEDITARPGERSEQERGDARLREAERIIGVGSWEFSLSDRTVTFSEGFARVVGLSARECCPVQECVDRVHPDDRGLLEGLVAACFTDGSASCECRLMPADAGLRTISICAERVDSGEGHPSYLRGAVLDVTEQRESERERFAAVSLFEQGFDAAPIAMALTTPVGGRFIRVNDAMCRLLDLSRDELMDLSVGEVTYPEDRDVFDKARQAMLDGAMRDFQFEKRYARKDGSVVWAAVHVAPVVNAEGEVEAFYAQKVDITEAKQREAELAHYVSDAIWLGRIRDAIDDDRLLLYEQPIVDLRTGETVQRELLLRMRSEDGTIIAPGEFLPVAERYGLITEIDRLVIRQAVQLAADGKPTQFNLSAASIGDPDILRELSSAIEAAAVDPRLLVVELTETGMMKHGEGGRVFAAQLRALGCGLALDDFGTGFASLSQLKYLDADHVKIDIEFVRDLVRSETDERLIRGIVGFAREFSQITTAEGIEDEQTLAKLRELGVDRGQGYLFSPPRPLQSVQSPAPVETPTQHGCLDPVATVRASFAAFAGQDEVAVRRLFHPDALLRLFATPKRADRNGTYRGHAEIGEYLRQVREVWDDLRLTPTAIWQAGAAIIVFGRATARADGHTTTSEVLWVYRLRDGLIATVDAFPQGHGAGPITRELHSSDPVGRLDLPIERLDFPAQLNLPA